MGKLHDMALHYISRISELRRPKKYFSKVYSRNLWEGKNSRSGQGSEGEFAIQKKKILGEIIKDYKIESILDIGCGDFYWMREVVQLVQKYHGVDVVDDLVRNNIKEYGCENVTFQCLDVSLSADQARLSARNADLIICLDVFGHLLNKEVDSLLRFILCDLDSQYILLTNRREEGSADYLKRRKSRLEGIDLEYHPCFVEAKLDLVTRSEGKFPNDFYDCYRRSMKTE